jgi:hypothetical protein
MPKLLKLEINFPVEMEVTREHLQLLEEIACKVCALYETQHPGRIAWAFGQGQKMLIHPMAIEDDKPIPFDESTFEIQVAEREAYPGERNHKR